MLIHFSSPYPTKTSADLFQDLSVRQRFIALASPSVHHIKTATHVLWITRENWSFLIDNVTEESVFS